MSEQRQEYCRQCGQWRRHVRTSYSTPHLVWLVAILGLGLLMGFWIAILLGVAGWILHASMVTLDNARSPYCCTVCGQNPRDRTPAEEADREARRAEETARRARRRGAALARSCDRARLALRRACRALVSLPARFDRLLFRLAGEGNSIVYRFLEVLATAVLLAAIAGAAYVLVVLATIA